MAAENGEDPVIEVADDEEYTDKKTKQRILNARELLTKAEHELFSERLVNPDVDYTELDALLSWGDLVRSYIRDLSILLNHEDLPESEIYREQVELGTIQLLPPKQNGYDFSKIALDGYTEKDLLREFSDFERGAELPKPKARTFNGLMSIVRSDNILTENWVVVKNPRAAPPNREKLHLTAQQPIPKSIYEAAIMKADEFLQKANIGVEIEVEAYMGTGEPGL